MSNQNGLIEERTFRDVFVEDGILQALTHLATSTATAIYNFGDDKVQLYMVGLPFVILGASATGKTTLHDWLEEELDEIDEQEYVPTVGVEVKDGYRTHIGKHGLIKLRPIADVGGENPSLRNGTARKTGTNTWSYLFNSNPKGVIFLIDHEEPARHVEALERLLDIILGSSQVRANLKAVLILVNKMDEWKDEYTSIEIAGQYSEQISTLRAIGKRANYDVLLGESSLLTGEGVTAQLEMFFNVLRSAPRRDIRLTDEDS